MKAWIVRKDGQYYITRSDVTPPGMLCPSPVEWQEELETLDIYMAYLDTKTQEEIKIAEGSAPIFAYWKAVVNPDKKMEYDKKLFQSRLGSLRVKRDKQLAETDWTQLPDTPFSDPLSESYQIRKDFKKYRQDLRDFPSKVSLSGEITINNYTDHWPIKPEA